MLELLSSKVGSKRFSYMLAYIHRQALKAQRSLMSAVSMQCNAIPCYAAPSRTVPLCTVGPQSHGTSQSILKVIIHARALVLAHILLLLVHLDYHSTSRRLFDTFIIPFFDEPWESQADSLATTIRQRRSTGFIPWTERQIGRFHLPDETRLEPDVWLVFGNSGMGVERFGFSDDGGGELGVQFLEDGLGEAGADIADCFEMFGGGVVAGE